MDMQLTDRDRAIARAELLSMMAKAEEKIANGTDAQMLPMSGRGSDQMSWVTREHLVGIHIYEMKGHGWYGDLLLRDVPLGQPEALGTPTRRPLKTEAEAREQVFGLLVCILSMIAKRGPPEQKKLPARFSLDEVDIEMDPKIFTLAEEVAIKLDDQPWRFHELFDELRRDCFNGQPMTIEGLEALPLHKRIGINLLCAKAHLVGITHHPPTAPWDSITCPKCGLTSYNPRDVQTGYCGKCNEFWREE